jgi:hypothetical protein
MFEDVVFGRSIGTLKLGLPVVKLSFANIRSDLLAYKFSARSDCKTPITIRQSHSQSPQEKFWTFSTPDIALDLHLFLHLDSAYEIRGRGLILDFYVAESCTLDDVAMRVDYLSSLSGLIRRYLPALVVFPAGIELIQIRGRARFGHILRGLFFASVVRYGLIYGGFDAGFMLLGHHSSSFVWDYITLVVLIGVGTCMLDLYCLVAGGLRRIVSFLPSGEGLVWTVLRAMFYGLFVIGTLIGLPNHLVVVVSFVELLFGDSKGLIVWKLYLLHLMLLILTIPQLLPWIQGIPALGVFSWEVDSNPMFTIPFLVFGWSLRRCFWRSRVILPILFKIGGWILILFGIRTPHLFEAVVWVLITALAIDFISSKLKLNERDAKRKQQ